MEFHTWLAFMSLVLIATLTPGTACLLVVAHALKLGWQRSLFTVLGNVTGLLLMSTMSVLGLSIIITQSSWLFAAIKYSGAAYLVYMGIKIALSRGISMQDARRGNVGMSKGKRYLQGVLVALTNPKAIVFTTALFPQFITVSAPIWPQFVILVGSFMLSSLVCLSGYAVMAQTLANRVTSSRQNLLWLQRGLGAGFIGAGVSLGLQK